MKLYGKVDAQQPITVLADVSAGVSDKTAMYKLIGEVMRGSIAQTFREEGSPAGSWPALAASTLRKKAYTSGHKLLILSGRLFGSITYVVTDILTIGTALVYAAVQNFGSADRGAGEGPQARIPGRDVHVTQHAGHHLRAIHYRMRSGVDAHGRAFRVPEPVRKGPGGKLFRGPLQQTSFNVGEHRRFQNIPARPFMVFRPEDPGRMVTALETYLAAKAGRLGSAGAQ